MICDFPRHNDRWAARVFLCTIPRKNTLLCIPTRTMYDIWINRTYSNSRKYPNSYHKNLFWNFVSDILYRFFYHSFIIVRQRSFKTFISNIRLVENQKCSMNSTAYSLKHTISTKDGLVKYCGLLIQPLIDRTNILAIFGKRMLPINILQLSHTFPDQFQILPISSR